MTSYFQLIVIHFWQKILAIKNPLDLILAPSKGGMRCVRTHVTRSQLELKRARCKISNKGYLSLNIFVILCHNTIWRGPSRREHSRTHPTDTPLHIQLLQKVTDSDKLVYISHPARGDSDSGEHSLADSKGVDVHPGPALRKTHSLEYIDIEARTDPASREHSLAKHSGTKDLPGPAHSVKDITAYKESPASRGPDSREHSTAEPFRDIDDSIAHSHTHRTAHKSKPASRDP